MLKIVAIKLNTHGKVGIQTLHTDLTCSTTQSTFKNISAGLTRQTKNEDKDSNSSNTSLFTSLFRIQQPSSQERHAQMGATLVPKFGHTLGATVVFFLSTPYKSFGL